MYNFLDASGLNQYHTEYKTIVDSSLNRLHYDDLSLANYIEAISNDLISLNFNFEDLAKLRLNAEPSAVFVDASTTISFTLTCKETADTLTIQDSSGNTIASGSGTSLVGSTEVNPDSEGILGFTATAVVNGTTMSTKTQISCVNKIYYGYGDSYTDVTTYADPSPKPQGIYSIEINSAGKKIYFIVPSSMTIANVSMNGLVMPMNVSTVTKDGVSYKVYESVNTYVAGAYMLALN